MLKDNSFAKSFFNAGIRRKKAIVKNVIIFKFIYLCHKERMGKVYFKKHGIFIVTFYIALQKFRNYSNWPKIISAKKIVNILMPLKYLKLILINDK